MANTPGPVLRPAGDRPSLSIYVCTVTASSHSAATETVIDCSSNGDGLVLTRKTTLPARPFQAPQARICNLSSKRLRRKGRRQWQQEPRWEGLNELSLGLSQDPSQVSLPRLPRILQAQKNPEELSTRPHGTTKMTLRRVTPTQLLASPNERVQLPSRHTYPSAQ